MHAHFSLFFLNLFIELKFNSILKKLIRNIQKKLKKCDSKIRTYNKYQPLKIYLWIKQSSEYDFN